MHARALMLGLILYVTLLLVGAVGWAVVEEWLETNPTDVLTDLRTLLTSVSLVLTALWVVARHHLEAIVRRRSR